MKTIAEWPEPRQINGVQAFLGLVNFYRNFVRTISEIARPVHDLLQKDKQFHFRPDQREAFKNLKDSITSSPVLAISYRNRLFRIETDASKLAIGAVLLQKGSDGMFHPGAYYSRSILPAERNYTVQETELLALLDFLEKWRHFISGTHVQGYRDHQSLTNWKTFKNPTGS